jgi:xanthine dehydrogenase accessory factor
MKHRWLIWVRGAGELGSACSLSLHRVGFQVVLTEREQPLAIRRTVTFSDAVYDGSSSVEGVVAELCDVNNIQTVLKSGTLPLLIDTPDIFDNVVTPDLIVDARMTKRGDDLHQLAPRAIGLGPGFHAGVNCDCAIETMRGHDLGRLLWNEAAKKDTGVPGVIGGESVRRVLRSPAAGDVKWHVRFGESVEDGQAIGEVGAQLVTAPFGGRIRGMIHPQTPVEEGMKIADVDPRGKEVDEMLTSDKSRAVARAVLEAVMILRYREGFEL